MRKMKFKHHSINKSFDRLRDELWDDHINKELIPLSHIIEKNSKWILEVDLPLVNKNDIELVLTANHIVITAKLTKTYYVSKFDCVREFNYFKKITSLPPSVDKEKIKAEFHSGILKIYIPKIMIGRKIPVG